MSGAVESNTLLLVEDEVITSMAGMKALERQGYAVLTAASGEEAIACVRANPSIDLILMDIDLGGGIDGTETAEIILRDREIPVVFLSSHTEPEIVDKTERITSYGYIVKNSGITVLAASIRMAFKLFEARMREKEQREVLRMSQEHLQSIFRIAPTGIGVLRDRVFVNVNARICMMTGYEEDELLGRSARMLYPTEEDFDYVGKEKYAQIREKGTGIVETRWKRRDGRIINVLLASTPLDFEDLTRGVTFTALDITDRKEAEEALRAVTSRLEGMLNALPDLMFEVGLDGRYYAVHSGSHELLTFPQEELLGKTIFDVLPEDASRIALAAIEEAHATGRSMGRQYALSLPRGDLWFELSIAAMPGVRGREPRFICLARDITDRKRAEKGLVDKIRELEKFNRLMVGRENRMIELKDEINELHARLGLPAKFAAPQDLESAQ
jgi:PAS domain S-box-containing protein